MASPRRGPLQAFRIADPRHPIFDGTGAMMFGARWNSPGRRIIYAAGTYAGALIETLVHASGSVPRNLVYIGISIPAGMPIDVIAPEEVPGWDAPSSEVARSMGDRWYDEQNTPVLIVPSVVTRVESNVLLNQTHPDFGLIQTSAPRPVLWDDRLWVKR